MTLGKQEPPSPCLCGLGHQTGDSPHLAIPPGPGPPTSQTTLARPPLLLQVPPHHGGQSLGWKEKGRPNRVKSPFSWVRDQRVAAFSCGPSLVALQQGQAPASVDIPRYIRNGSPREGNRKWSPRLRKPCGQCLLGSHSGDTAFLSKSNRMELVTHHTRYAPG